MSERHFIKSGLAFRGLVVFGLVIGLLVALYSLRKQPSVQDIWKQGLEFLSQREFSKTIESIERLRQQNPDSDYAELLEAAVSIRTGSPDQGLRRLSRMNVEGPRRREILLLSGEALYQLNMLAEARGTLVQLVSEDPDSVDGHRWLSSIWYDLGANAQAIHHLTEVTRLDKYDYRPHWLMGVMYRDFENFPESIRHLEAAWVRKPPQGVRNDIGVFLSRSLQAEHQYEKALSYLQSCDPIPDVLVEKSKALFNLTRTQEAGEILQQCEVPTDDQSGSEYFLTFGDVLEARGDQKGALGKYEEGVAKFPHNEDLQYRLATILKALGESERATVEMAKWEKKNALKNRLVELNKVAAEQPDNAQVRFELSDICEQMQRPALANMWKAAAEACKKTKPATENAIPSASDAN